MSAAKWENGARRDHFLGPQPRSPEFVTQGQNSALGHDLSVTWLLGIPLGSPCSQVIHRGDDAAGLAFSLQQSELLISTFTLSIHPLFVIVQRQIMPGCYLPGPFSNFFLLGVLHIHL